MGYSIFCFQTFFRAGTRCCPCGACARATAKPAGAVSPDSVTSIISGYDVNKAFLHQAIARCLLALLTLALAACGTPPAKDFRGAWKPVNRFQSTPTEIPLKQPYTFYASPMDETLKTMLDRWARDTGRTLSYNLDYDVTLYKPVAEIRTADIEAAAATLNDVYAQQGILVIAHPRDILVQAAGNPAPTVSSGGADPAPPKTTSP